ncbi:MAG: competence/damage-inducible protein A [Gemmatimonadetes bacterium]|nr:competence/damage-inducible protein A [Gemmatimonadota bacterium]
MTVSGAAAVPRVEIVTVGDELLSGQSIDTNAAWLGRRLGELGFDVVRRATVGDRAEDIRAAVGGAAARADVVLVTGGLGPTPDDITKDVVAAHCGFPLVIDEALLEELRERFRKRGYTELPASNRRQAEVPAGARVLRNPRGTAPGLVLELDGSTVILLPGVPRELKGLMDPQVVTYLEQRFGSRLAPVRHRLIRTTGIAESALADRIARAIGADDIAPVALAFLPDLTGVDLRLTVRGVADRVEAEAHLDRVAHLLAPAVEPYRYTTDDEDVAAVVGRLLRAQSLTLAVAESCTGGLVTKRLTDHAGASDYVVGGVIAYANDVKVAELDVDSELLESEGAVSEEVARAMASGVARRFGADAGLSVTGIAGPGGGTPAKPVGTVWHAVALSGSVTAVREHFPGDREEIRTRAAQAALAHLWARLRRGSHANEPLRGAGD